MIFKKTLALGLCLLMVTSLFAGCSSNSANKVSASSQAASYSVTPAAEEKTILDSFVSGKNELQTQTTEAPSLSDSASNSGVGIALAGPNIPATIDTARKIIKNVQMRLETLEFDQLISSVTDKVSAVGGYIESSSVSGNTINFSGKSSRNATISARIPQKELDGFLSAVGSMANVVSKTENSNDVTLSYVDTESRKKSLEIEQERLFALLEKADVLENIIALETRLSEVRYQIENLTSQLRSIDSLVDYSTVSLDISEVVRITETENKTVLQRIQNGFSGTLYNISDSAKDFFVWFVVNLPYLFIWAVIIIVGLLLFRRFYVKKRKQHIYTPPIAPTMPQVQPPQNDEQPK